MRWEMFSAMGSNKKTIAWSLLVAVSAIWSMAPVGAHADAPTDLDTLVRGVMSHLSNVQKLQIIRGVEEGQDSNIGEAGYWAGIPTVGLKAFRLADGPPGVLVDKPSSAQVATMGVAATFDPEVARENGEIIADEARRLGIFVVLQPFINIDRDITYSRAYNTFGEDPFLVSAMGASEITGIQSRGVMADAKHFIGYDSDGQFVSISDKALHEVYLAPFAAAIKAGVASIMCSYNHIDGPYSCANHDMLTRVLRNELHFKGVVMSDWGAVHDNLGVAAGLDLEMPGILGSKSPFAGIIPAYYDYVPPPHHLPPADYALMSRIFDGSIPEEPKTGSTNWAFLFPYNTRFQNIYDALSEGKVTPGQVNTAAYHVLYSLGMMNALPGQARPSWPSIMPKDEIRRINLKTAEKAATLLKNNGILPLLPKDLSDIALIGPGALQVISVGKASERSFGEPGEQTSPARVLSMMSGQPILTAVADDMDGELVGIPGVHRVTQIGDNRVTTVENAIDYTNAKNTALPANSSTVWDGTITTPKTGDFWFTISVLGNRPQLFIDGKRIVGTHAYKGALHGDVVLPNEDSVLPSRDGLDNVRISVALSAGVHSLRLEAVPDGSGNPEQVRLGWTTPKLRSENFARAVDAARKARKVVLFVWSRGAPTFKLPGDQDELVDAVTKVNPNTVVVLNSVQPVALPWLNKAAAIVQMWWSGDEGGTATANILTGRANPGGRLPMTWGRVIQDYPANDERFPERSASGINGKTRFSEELDIGYRWFEKLHHKPLYPFGYGLSYTTFSYEGFKVQNQRGSEPKVVVSIRNTGLVAGDVTPQIYLGAPKGSEMEGRYPIEKLVAFARVHLSPGEVRAITLPIERGAFAYWSTEDHGWKFQAVERPLRIADSAEDVRFYAAISLH